MSNPSLIDIKNTLREHKGEDGAKILQQTYGMDEKTADVLNDMLTKPQAWSALYTQYNTGNQAMDDQLADYLIIVRDYVPENIDSFAALNNYMMDNKIHPHPAAQRMDPPVKQAPAQPAPTDIPSPSGNNDGPVSTDGPGHTDSTPGPTQTKPPQQAPTPQPQQQQQQQPQQQPETPAPRPDNTRNYVIKIGNSDKTATIELGSRSYGTLSIEGSDRPLVFKNEVLEDLMKGDDALGAQKNNHHKIQLLSGGVVDQIAITDPQGNVIDAKLQVVDTGFGMVISDTDTDNILSQDIGDYDKAVRMITGIGAPQTAPANKQESPTRNNNNTPTQTTNNTNNDLTDMSQGIEALKFENARRIIDIYLSEDGHGLENIKPNALRTQFNALSISGMMEVEAEFTQEEIKHINELISKTLEQLEEYDFTPEQKQEYLASAVAHDIFQSTYFDVKP